MTTAVERFQITAAQAEQYESKFVPALFGEWAPVLVRAAGIVPDDSVLDVACGTGVVAREVAGRLGADGAVVGLDLNEAMLAVARRVQPGIEWRQGDVSQLPFADGSFDVVLCQAAIMFFPDAALALREMARVVAENGTVAIQVFAGLSDQPGYGPLVDVVARHAGPEARELMGSYWRLGDPAELRRRLEGAGLTITSWLTRLGTATFDSIDELVTTEVESTPLIDRIDDSAYRRIRQDARRVLAGFEDGGGAAIPIRGHVIVAQKRPEPANTATVNDTERAVRSLMERYAGAVNVGDATAYATLIAPDGIRIPPGSDPQYGPEQMARSEQSDYDLAEWHIEMRLIDAIALGERWVYGLVQVEAILTFHADGRREERHATKAFLLEQQESGAWLIKRYIWNLKV